ncbi:MAG: fasciclin domain-containing protein [Alkalibacterium sp.]|nr:fasciclin domain-containing protein [Alkalibacterium sp.]
MSKMFKALLSIVTALMLTVALAPTAFAENHEEEPQTIVDIAVGNDDFSILVAALQQAELVETLQGDGPFTVFAPTNDAFAALLEALDITAEELLAQPDLANVLLYHVVSGQVMAGDLEDGMEAETVNGETVTFDLSGDPMVNDSTIVQTDIEASNGVIHVIDAVLVPSNFTLQDVEMEEDAVPETGVESNVLLLAGLVVTAGAFIFVYTKKQTA